jgi:hypothetical protein
MNFQVRQRENDLRELVVRQEPMFCGILPTEEMTGKKNLLRGW